jgi:hypothetical protein
MELRKLYSATGVVIGEYPSEIFKFTSREYAELMVSVGQAYVGTLYQYRNIERLGEELGDAGEGTSQRTDIPKPGNWKDGGYSDVVHQSIGAPPGADIELALNVFTHRRTVRNGYIYCTSVELSEIAMRKMKAEAAVRIRDVPAFARALDAALRLRVNDIGRSKFDACSYIGRDRDASSPDLNPAWVKDERFSYQREYRGAWDVSGDRRLGEDEGVVVRSPAIANVCEIALVLPPHRVIDSTHGEAEA